ncbi:transcription antiterminator [Fusobacterium polymorphum]|uniref:Transcriptional regulator n=1 Tax=Fusobacterium nucleatum subsp. polymorphum TaxID=76857 RepID=A0A1Z3CEK7_FUSNP|nr:transcription antiterminator [Fusobacterium polymorphum]ASC02049.1 transcriptional regulator [Fusobacterium polymorphum]BEO92417.1 transcription antiterminator [Fusobacterium nucleatum]BEP04492.1 transcription antiterminator [Fusobacterium nucleatum]
MLKKQHFELLKLIENEKKLSKIAELLNLTERSVRYKIDEINEELGIKKIQIKKREFFSSLTDEDMIKLFENIEGEKYVYNQKEREELIILYTLMRKDNFLLKEVAEKIGTSKSTIRNDLKSLKKMLLDYNIKLLQDDKLKYYFDYLEEDYRYFIATYLYKYVSFDKKYDKIFFDDISYFRKVIYKEIKEEYMTEIESISKKIKKIELDFMDETLNILVILMAISQKRERKNTNLKIENIEILEKREEYLQLKKVFTNFSNINLLFFTDYLFRITRDERDVFIKFKNWLDISVAISKTVRAFEIENKIDLKNIDVFLDEIFYYIKPLIFRTKRKIKLKNSILKDIKKLYPSIFNFLKKNFYFLEEVIDEKVSDEEIAYLVPFFHKALQNNNKINKKGILVTTYKENIALFLKEDIETEFLIDIDKILTLKSFEQIEKKIENYDYILTTFSVEKDFVKEIEHTKIIELNPILTEKDIKKLEEAGLTKNKKIKMTTLLKVILENSSDVNVKKLINSLDEAFPEKIYNDVDRNKFLLENFLKPENIFKVNLNSFEEILNKFLKLSFLQKNDINDIINRVSNNNFYSYLGEKIGIIFHKLNTKNSQDNVLIAINEKEIYINSKKIDTIILINSNCEIKYKAIIYNFVKLFFQNKKISFNNNRLDIYDYLISNI